MKKKVNGKVVDIKNISLFEKGFEGLALDRKASSNVKDTLDGESDIVKVCVDTYNTMINSLPFPLFAIESDCKYVFIANYMLNKISELKKEDVLVDKASILIILDRNKALRLVYKTWAIEKRKSEENSVSLTLDDYKNEVEYNELKWCYDKYMNGEKLGDYYKTFMGEFMAACNNNPMVLNWELNNILQFGYVPDEMVIDKNRIVNVVNNYEYFLDVFCSGKAKSDDKVVDIYVGKGGSFKTSTKNKLVKVYDFEVYGKLRGSKTAERENKIEKKQFDGMGSVFNEIVRAGVSDDKVEEVVYHGIMDGDTILYEIGNRLYQCSTSKFTQNSELIASRISIYSYESGRLYMKNSTKLPSGVYKDCIYAYDSTTKKARLCKTSFRRADK